MGVIKEIIATAIDVSLNTTHEVDVEYSGRVKKLTIRVHLGGPTTMFKDGLCKQYYVSVENEQLLKLVLDELLELKNENENDFLD